MAEPDSVDSLSVDRSADTVRYASPDNEPSPALSVGDAALALTRSLPDPAFVIDASGKFLSVFAAENDPVRQLRDELLGRRFSDIFSASDADQYLATVTSTLETGRPQTIEYPLPGPDGVHWFEAHHTPAQRERRPPGRGLGLARHHTLQACPASAPRGA